MKELNRKYFAQGPGPEELGSNQKIRIRAALDEMYVLCFRKATHVTMLTLRCEQLWRSCPMSQASHYLAANGTLHPAAAGYAYWLKSRRKSTLPFVVTFVHSMYICFSYA